jgi:hypothetical protein
MNTSSILKSFEKQTNYNFCLEGKSSWIYVEYLDLEGNDFFEKVASLKEIVDELQKSFIFVRPIN